MPEAAYVDRLYSVEYVATYHDDRVMRAVITVGISGRSDNTFGKPLTFDFDASGIINP